eukprot:scaffold14154_cov114-Skeletonema_dohrnii-CCMP3373.AAC.6
MEWAVVACGEVSILVVAEERRRRALAPDLSKAPPFLYPSMKPANYSRKHSSSVKERSDSTTEVPMNDVPWWILRTEQKISLRRH